MSLDQKFHSSESEGRTPKFALTESRTPFRW